MVSEDCNQGTQIMTGIIIWIGTIGPQTPCIAASGGSIP
jgi:hypothetical protein